MSQLLFKESSVANEAKSVLKDKPSLYSRARGAAGKAFLVYLGTGSIGVAIVAFIIFKLAGC